MQNSEPNWDKIEQDLWHENAKNVVNELKKENPNIIKKIETYIWRFGYSYDEVVQKIYDDPMFASWFSKEPRRQGMHEIIASQYLEKIDGIVDFSILPKGGKNARYINSDGFIISGSELHDKAGSKSLDFFWVYNNIECYASHKYTKESGGNQDSQYKEQLELLKKFMIRTKGEIAFFSICDGIYYNDKRMNELKSLTRDKKPFSFACHIQDIKGILDKFFV